MRPLVFVILICCCFACAPATEERIAETWPGGEKRLVYVVEVENDTEVKVFEKQYHENGQLLFEGALKNDKRMGVWTSFYATGKKWSEHTFVDGEKHGISSNWYENGNLRFIGETNMGKPIGIWKFYDEEGALANEKNYDL